MLGSVDVETFFKDFKCNSEEKIEPISEIELKAFLGTVARLGNYWNDNKYNQLIDIALSLNYDSVEKEEFAWEEDVSTGTHYGYLVDDVHNIITSFYEVPDGMEIMDKDFYEILEKNGKKYYTETAPGCGYSSGSVIDIKDITYLDGKYNITYTYWLQGEQSVFEYDSRYGQCQILEKNIEIVKNEDGALTSYKILSISENNEAY